MGNPLERQSFDLGWLIGIIDGEGCFTLSSVRKTPKGMATAYHPRIQITNTNIRIIEKAKGVLSTLGLTCYIYTRFPKIGRPYYRLEIAGLKRVKKLMDEVGHLFECRSSQAELLRQYVEVRLSKRPCSPMTDDEHSIALALADLNANRTT